MPYASRRGVASRAQRYLQASRARGRGAAASARTTVAKFPLSSKRNRPVWRRLRKSYAPYKVKNRMAITTLARQVKSLQNRMYGDIETQTQFITLDGSGQNNISPANPFLFLLSDFNPTPVYYGTITSGAPGYTGLGVFNPQGFQGDLDDNYEWNAKRNQAKVSPFEYKPVYCRLQFTFDYARQGMSDSLNPDAIFRITILKLKPKQATTAFNVNLPGALGAYRNLAVDPGTATRNYFDKDLHHIVYDKWIRLRNYNRTADEQTRYSKTVTIPFKFPDMVLRPHLTATPAGQTVWSNIPISQQYWCLISRNESQQTDVKFNISRFLVWRDGQAE